MITYIQRLCVASALCLATLNAIAEKKPKNIILLIGDGMGPQQLGLLFSYAKLAPNSIYKGKTTGIEQLLNRGETGLSLTHPADKVVTDSACSATQLATGYPTRAEIVGLDAEGNHVKTVLEIAKENGKKTGLVSDTRLTHATPAAFAAHQPHRSLEDKIAVQMLENRVDVMFSAGLNHWIPMSVNDDNRTYHKFLQKTGGTIPIFSLRTDNRNLIAEAEHAGYSVAFNRYQLKSARLPALGLFGGPSMTDGIENSSTINNHSRTEPTLKEMTEKALSLLDNNEKGFFLMVEGGQIDWAGHANDTATMLHEMIKFDDAVTYVYEWASKRKDTIVVLTADHETGGFGFTYSKLNVPPPVALSGNAFKQHMYTPSANFVDPSVLDKIYTQKKSLAELCKDYNALRLRINPAKLLLLLLHV